MLTKVSHRYMRWGYFLIPRMEKCVQDANICPDQEINYLRQYTKGDPQTLVDIYRKRKCREPTSVLQRFGNSAVITNTLLKKLSGAAKLSEKETEKLQVFADTYADVDSQLNFLPGLAFLTYPNAIKPIVEKLPSYLWLKWEKQVAEYAESDHIDYTISLLWYRNKPRWRTSQTSLQEE